MKRKYSFFLLSIVILVTVVFLACNQSEFKTVTNTAQSSPTDCRVVQHFAGTTCIPKKASLRIVTLHLATLGNVMTLGVKPIGSATGFRRHEFPTHFADTVNGVESVGGVTQPSLEKIAKLKPDLIIYLSSNKSLYPLLSRIAPTVQDDWQGPVQWKKHFSFVAQVLGQKNTYQQAWERYHKRIQDLKVALGDRYRSKKFSFVYLQHSNYAMFISELKNVFAGSILNDAGLQRTKIQDVVNPSGYVFVPMEELQKIDGDFIFMGIYGDDDKQAREQLQKMPLWKTLKAVQENHVFFVDLQTWREANLLAADAVIDDLYKYLVNTP